MQVKLIKFRFQNDLDTTRFVRFPERDIRVEVPSASWVSIEIEYDQHMRVEVLRDESEGDVVVRIQFAELRRVLVDGNEP